MNRPRGGASPVDPVREAAATVLMRWQRGRRHVESLLAAVEPDLEARGLSDPDRRRLREIVFGTVRLKGRYQHLIQRHQRKRQKLKPPVEVPLWIALHELTEMHTPAHAVVDQAVRLTQSLGAGYAKGFVNAVLRSVARDGVAEPTVHDPIEHATHWLSHPRWLVERWCAALGPEEMLELCRANNRRPHLTLRAAPGRRDAVREELQRRDVAVRDTPPGAPDALEVDGNVPAPALFARLGHEVVAQDTAAQRVAPLVIPGAGGVVLDLCAAPGGKTTHLAQRLGTTGRVVAADLSARRLGPLLASRDRLGLDRIDVVVADGRHPAWPDHGFDAVLVDAPCTGTGVLARRHDARWLRRPEDLTELPALQADLLHRAIDAARPGGVIVYATCSLEPEENDGVVDAVLRARDDVVERGVRDSVPAAMLRLERYQTWPHRHGEDGAFAARLEKRST